jgi:phosphoenolpyruvate synthase/pyruvate phosphate dikinase
MVNRAFLSTSEYAKKYKISKMQVTRLIRAGKVVAQKIGKTWMIEPDSSYVNQIGLEKTTSLQKWNKIIGSIFHKSLAIEESKDREIIYSKLHGLGLPHERCIAFPLDKFPTKRDFEVTVGRLGFPYWISAVPNPRLAQLNRQAKLRVYDISSGWEFMNKLPDKEDYKFIVSQYADNPDFKGTALVAKSGHGVVEFITGDRHYIMTRGFTLTDPMLFDQDSIKRFSNTVAREMQRKLYDLLRGIYGHLEFQYGSIDKRKRITFFDYNDEKAYIEIEKIWGDLLTYFTKKRRKIKRVLYGLPASPGQAVGRCTVVHHETTGMYDKIKKGDILVSDTTTPEMTMIMKKASAIVTDLGGVTCHAAIVCRELKIPAIVGVTNATELLKTGDTLSVDADKGEIKIL